MITPPARNRVTPLGEIVATPGRGAWMGNRGVLHEGREIVRSSRNKAWIICALSFKERSLPQWEPGRNTQPFFLDQQPAVVVGDHVSFWMPDKCYGRRVDRPRTGKATVVSPPASVAALRGGYPLQIDDTAR